MTSLSSMLQAGQAFKRLKCETNGCTHNRPGLSPLCTGHQLKRARYGHPLGRSIPQKAYKTELKEVRAFFNDHPDHPAIAAAVAFFERWMQQAGKQEADVGQGILVRLHGHAVAALDIVTEVSALWLYALRNPQQLPDDLRLSFALARGALRLAGYERKAYGDTKRATMKHPRMKELQGTGERIRHTLARFFINLTCAINANADSARAIKTNLATPFA